MAGSCTHAQGAIVDNGRMDTGRCKYICHVAIAHIVRECCCCCRGCCSLVCLQLLHAVLGDGAQTAPAAFTLLTCCSSRCCAGLLHCFVQLLLRPHARCHQAAALVLCAHVPALDSLQAPLQSACLSAYRSLTQTVTHFPANSQRCMPAHKRVYHVIHPQLHLRSLLGTARQGHGSGKASG